MTKTEEMFLEGIQAEDPKMNRMQPYWPSVSSVSLWWFFLNKSIYHRDTEDTEVAPRNPN